MDIKELLIINKVIDYKKQTMTWETAAGMVVEKTLTDEIAEKSQKEYLKRLEQEQYINSLS